MFGLLCNTIFLISFGLASALWIAIAVRFLAGAGNGNIAVTRAYIGDISTREQLPARMGMIGASFGLGFMIGPFVGGILTDPASTFGGLFATDWWEAHPYFLPCLTAGLLSAVSFILAIRMLPESLPKKRGVREKEKARDSSGTEESRRRPRFIAKCSTFNLRQRYFPSRIHHDACNVHSVHCHANRERRFGLR